MFDFLKPWRKKLNASVYAAETAKEHECPTCGADPGSECVIPSWSPLPVMHVARIRKAEAANG